MIIDDDDSPQIHQRIPNQFEWDAGNQYKIAKHKVRQYECEQVFTNRPLILFLDHTHSQTEQRFVVLGQTHLGRKLTLIITIRNQSIRVISARPQSKKERGSYAKEEET